MRQHRPFARLLGSAALFLACGVLPAAAEDCDEALVPQPEDCRRQNADVAVSMPVGENTELIRAPGDLGAAGFSISIDNETVAGAPAPPDRRRPADIASAAARVDLRYDGLIARRYLNVSTGDLRAAYRAGEAVSFRTSSNYPAWVRRAEVRIIDRAARGAPVVAVLPAQPNGTVGWRMPETGSAELAYVLRVYDDQGRYDETAALPLDRTDRAFPTHATTAPVIAAGEGEDRTRLRLIPQRGGAVTVSGEGAAGRPVRVMGEEVPVDAAGRFVTSRILPAGDHVVEVRVGEERILRDVTVPQSEWFHVGLVDLTFGRRLDDDQDEADPDYERTYVDGRLAGYAKGRTEGGVGITVSVDTGEGRLKDAFRRLDEKDPRHLLKRLDAADTYPTYGDDSTAYDDAPTSGRLYVRVEKEGSSLTWGDFKTDVRGTEFLRQSRALYGAELKWLSRRTVESGDARAAVSLYAASPDTLPQRDILRGTGGSIYFLSRQDINGGSETVVVEVVDPDTGRVVERRTLIEGVDYDIDYLQGVILLAEPLGSSATGGGLIGDGSSGRYDVNLLVQYEYTPATGSLSGMAGGGRAELWATDALRLGVTAMTESTGAADQKMAGVDLRYALGETSYIEAEIATTDGPGFGRAISTDGGLTIDRDGIAGAGSAMAYRLETRLDFGELGLARPGSVELYYERKETGFSTLTEDITDDQTLFGVKARVEATPRLGFSVDAETFRRDGGDEKDRVELAFSYRLAGAWTVEAGLAVLDKVTQGDPDETGRRTDLGARLTYAPGDDWSAYVFGQLTVDERGGLGDNDRIGLGGSYRFSEKLRASAEISAGDKGTGGHALLNYSPTADNELYFGYTLDPTRTGAGYDLVGRDRGKVVLGGRYRHDEHLSSYTESNWDLFGQRRSLARSYGVSYTPDARWTFSGGMEVGEVRDPANGDFDRRAVSFGMAYAGEDRQSARLRLEYRTEDGAGLTRDRRTWAVSGGYEYKLDDDWRFLANLDALVSRSDEDAFRDGEYIEARLGYAYRPVLHDRLNLLARYTYLRDLPGENQRNANGDEAGPKQVSHVLSVDANYDLTPKLTLGGKYALRLSDVADRGSDDFDSQRAHLGILRLDWHVVHKWDAMIEGRALRTEGTGMTETGALLALYRHVGNNAKIGLGYEWGRVSDDATDLDYDASGLFLNVVAKF